MTTNDDFILINYKKLAERMAEEEFHREFERNYAWHELYEQIDETGEWYLKMDFQLIMQGMQDEWESMLMNFDVINQM